MKLTTELYLRFQDADSHILMGPFTCVVVEGEVVRVNKDQYLLAESVGHQWFVEQTHQMWDSFGIETKIVEEE